MAKHKSNQVREAIFRTLGAEGERAQEITFRLRRLYAADRRLGRRPRSRDEAEHHYAFFSDAPPGTGADILFNDYEAFHPWPQSCCLNMVCHRQLSSDR